MKQIAKKRTPRKDFSQRLAQKLIESGLGKVKEGSYDKEDDDRWVTLEINDVKLSIEFDDKGEKIERIGLFQNVWEIVDEKQIWTTFRD
jgi:hypothetical protein